MSKTINSFVIDRREWLRGVASINSYLRHPIAELQCCLGFYAKACGFTNEEILSKKAPPELDIKRVPEWLLDKNAIGYPVIFCSDDCRNLMSLNDSIDLIDEAKESRITEIFARHGVSVTFIN